MKKSLNITEQEKRAIVNFLADQFSEKDIAVLNKWLENNEENKILFDELIDIWQVSLHKKIIEQINVQKAWDEISAKLKTNKSQHKILWQEAIRIAAVFVFALFIGGLGYYLFSKKVDENSKMQFVEYVSPLGSRSFVKLSDGSKVWLNSGSTLKYQHSYGMKNRDLKLSGEAYFEVAKNKKLPFVVQTSEINITALGTKFNVKAYPEEKTIETTLIEGSVKLKSTTVNLNQNILLKPNEKAVFTKKNQALELITQHQNKNNKVLDTTTKPKLEIIESVEPEPIVSWKDKRWVIRNEKLGDLAVKLERRYDVNFIFDNDLLKEYSFGGTLEDESLEQVMKAIQYSSPIKYIIDDKTVYIMADGKKVEKFKDLLMK
ncbi:MAG TPA: FecR family protein [Draconibacterium sp.]|nr:FecR family protein [Draconibacterium sp.]